MFKITQNLIFTDFKIKQAIRQKSLTADNGSRSSGINNAIWLVPGII